MIADEVVDLGRAAEAVFGYVATGFLTVVVVLVVAWGVALLLTVRRGLR